MSPDEKHLLVQGVGMQPGLGIVRTGGPSEMSWLDAVTVDIDLLGPTWSPREPAVLFVRLNGPSAEVVVSDVAHAGREVVVAREEPLGLTNAAWVDGGERVAYVVPSRQEQAASERDSFRSFEAAGDAEYELRFVHGSTGAVQAVSLPRGFTPYREGVAAPSSGRVVGIVGRMRSLGSPEWGLTMLAVVDTESHVVADVADLRMEAPLTIQAPQWSRDGTRLAVTSAEAESSVCTVSANGHVEDVASVRLVDALPAEAVWSTTPDVLVVCGIHQRPPTLPQAIRGLTRMGENVEISVEYSLWLVNVRTHEMHRVEDASVVLGDHGQCRRGIPRISSALAWLSQ